MAKKGGYYLCNNCGYETVRWMGRCPSCDQWNTMQEYREPALGKTRVAGEKAQVLAITGVKTAKEQRTVTGIGELDRVLGGGIVPGSLVLVGGEPGIGKSTLLLQAAAALARTVAPVLYFTGEESPRQVSMRAHRLSTLDDNLLLLAAHDYTDLEEAVASHKPGFVIVDSIQTIYHPQLSASPGTVSQVRECTAQLMRLAKQTGAAVFLVGHVTKEGSLAGPKTLEHMVDCVLYFEGDRHHLFRLLRCVKNRFGSTNEIGVFLMGSAGLEQVANPSELFMSRRKGNLPGSVVAATIEGSRALLVEVQSLVAATGFGNPRRTADGIDNNRLALLLAVLEKRGGLHLHSHDAYVKVVGGVQISEPAVDLAVLLAIASAFRDRPVNKGLVALGEVGLTGEIRPVPRVGQRLREAAKLGFDRAVLPEGCDTEGERGIELHHVADISQALDAAFGGDAGG